MPPRGPSWWRTPTSSTVPTYSRVVKPRGEVLRTWYTLKSEIFFLFLASVLIIFIVIFKLTDTLVKRMREADEKREAAFREIENTHKLSSIGEIGGRSGPRNQQSPGHHQRAGRTDEGSHRTRRGPFRIGADSIRSSTPFCRRCTAAGPSPTACWASRVAWKCRSKCSN